MQANEFDALLKSRYEEYQPEYNAAAWTVLAEKLPPTQSSRSAYALWPLAIGLAASFAAVLIFIARKPTSHHKTEEVASIRSAPQTSAMQSQSRLSESTGESATLLPWSKAVPDRAFHNQTNYPIAILDEPVISPPIQPQPTRRDLQATSESEQTKRLSTVPEIAKQHGPLEHPAFKEPPVEQSRPAKTIISIAGGVQYGSLNGGYAAGIQVEHKISNRWFAHTEISYQQYPASSTNQLSTVEYGLVSGGGQGMPVPGITQPKFQPNSIVQYIQASPGIGYHLTKRVSIGTSVDFQRALQSSDKKAFIVEGADFKLLPLLDVGATGQVSYCLSDRMEVSIQYRKGINNILESREVYLDRQYFQFQLKLPIIRR